METPSINDDNINSKSNNIFCKKESKIWKCEKCGIVFTFRSRYEEHKNRKTSCVKEEKQEYKCEDCGMIFMYKSKLEEHKNKKKPCKIEKEDIKKEILCKECGKTFSRKCNLEAHKEKCKGKHTLQCGRCYKFFSCIQSRFTHEKNGKCVPVEKPPIDYTKDDSLDKKIKELQDEIQNLKNENDKLKHLNKNTYSSVVPQEYIYILHNNINANENIYKIGKTKELCQTNVSPLIYVEPCENMDYIEQYITTELKKEFFHRPDIGSEYFQGDLYKMKIKIKNIVSEFEKNSQN